MVIRVAYRLTFGLITSFFSELGCVEVKQFLRFLKNDKSDLRKYFSGFRRKHLFITTCIEKHCTDFCVVRQTLVEVDS